MKKTIVWLCLIFSVILFILLFMFPEFISSRISYSQIGQALKTAVSEEKVLPTLLPIDTAAYDKKINEIANNPPTKQPTTKIIKDPKTGKETTVTVEPKPTPPNIWPVRTAYPSAGALLPFNRIIAYYGNLYSTKMGVLGEYAPELMLLKLDAEVKKWEATDPTTPVIPALHYVAVVAQAGPGEDGKYRSRMPGAEIDKVLAMAKKIPGIVFLDIQVGFSNVETEIPLLLKYLKMPEVHLGIDPEFSMKTGIRPGKIVGTLDAGDINFVTNYLAKIVRENNLPPKILVIHRYTQKMVTNYKKINILPEVQIVMHMDGWGGMAKKIGTYKNFIYPEPVQFTGFKLFYKNDIFTPGTVLMAPSDILKLSPQPIYIQYQ